MASPFGLAISRMGHESSHPALILLVSTTASVAVAVYEAIMWGGLVATSRQDKHAAARTISLLWKATLPQGLGFIVTLGVTSLVGGIRAIRGMRSGSRDRYLAISGTLLAVGHFTYAPAIAKVIQKIANAYDGLDELEAKEENRQEVVDDRVIEAQRQWLRIHAWRSFTVDVPAMLCFVLLALRRP